MPLVPREHNPSILAHRLGPPELRSLGKIIQLSCLSTFSTNILPPPLWSSLPHVKRLFPFESCFVKLFTKNHMMELIVYFRRRDSREKYKTWRGAPAQLPCSLVGFFSFLSIFLFKRAYFSYLNFHLGILYKSLCHIFTISQPRFSSAADPLIYPRTLWKQNISKFIKIQLFQSCGNSHIGHR